MSDDTLERICSMPIEPDETLAIVPTNPEEVEDMEMKGVPCPQINQEQQLPVTHNSSINSVDLSLPQPWTREALYDMIIQTLVTQVQQGALVRESEAHQISATAQHLRHLERLQEMQHQSWQRR